MSILNFSPKVLQEFIHGHSLASSLEQCVPFPLEQVRRYTSQLLDALLYLHQKAVVHKDLRVSFYTVSHWFR